MSRFPDLLDVQSTMLKARSFKARIYLMILRLRLRLGVRLWLIRPSAKMLPLLGSVLAVSLLLACVHVFPTMDPAGARLGMSMIGGTLATFFGFALVTLGINIRGADRARRELRSLVPKYTGIISRGRGPNLFIDELRKKYLELIRQGQFSLTDIAMRPLELTHGQILRKITALTALAIEHADLGVDWEKLQAELIEVGIPEHEALSVAFESSRAALSPRRFFKLLEDTIAPTGFAIWESNKQASTLAGEYVEESLKDSIHDLLDVLQREARATGLFFWVVASVTVLSILSLALVAMTLSNSTPLDCSSRIAVAIAFSAGILSIFLILIHLARIIPFRRAAY